MEGVADGGAYAKNVIRVEFVGVIDDVVVVRLGSEKDVPPYAVLDFSAKVEEQMSAIHMGGATRGIKAAAVWAVEKRGLSAGAGHENAGGLLSQVARVQRVEVINHRAKLLVVVIECVVVAKGNFGIVAIVILTDAVDADVGIKATLFGGRQVGLGSRSVLGGHQGATAGSNVELLGVSKFGGHEKHTQGNQKHELSQIQPPFVRTQNACPKLFVRDCPSEIARPKF